ncbi:MAG: NAD(P)/FAD-dependent oxidoreductase, partial [Firmicutes bacterium]|nr:NAD(P)/FAD-dependent oxidoreductase [Bacillota bacterium]
WAKLLVMGELRKIIDYYRHQVEQAGVKVELGLEASKEAVTAFQPDVVILATGGKSIRPAIEGLEQGNVYWAVDLLKNDCSDIGEKVAIIGGGQVGIETAEWLAEKGKEVTVIEMLPEVAGDMPHAVKIPLMLSLQDYGVRILTNARVKEIAGAGVLVERKGVEELLSADAVVIAVGMESGSSLEAKLQDKVQALYVVGDCKNPGKIMDAVHEGFKVGLQI